MTINILDGENNPQYLRQKQPSEKKVVVNQMRLIEETLTQPLSWTPEPAIFPIYPDILNVLDILPEPNSKVLAIQDYFQSGRLTRLPVPVSDIDLNVLAANPVPIEGTVNLTILIDADGLVVDVVHLTEIDELQAFSESVAERFKIARFIPGEIEGTAVKSQLQVTVVREVRSANQN